MSAANETIADIAAELRQDYKGRPPINRAETTWCRRQLADRIEAAAKRERIEVSTRAATSAVNLTNEKWERECGNAAKLREALVTIKNNIYRDECGDLHIAPDIIVEKVIEDALAAPPRNCEIGTVADQLERFGKWFPTSPYCDGQVHRMIVGYADWVQMPYEKGGVKS